MLHVHRAERADTLAEALADVLAEPAGRPFAAEVVAVPARGVERWLAQRLSHRLGAARAGRRGVRQRRLPLPRRGSSRRVLDGGPRRRPVAPGAAGVAAARGHRRVRRASRGAPPLGAHHRRDDRAAHATGRRFAAARHLAGLFAAYADAPARDAASGALARPGDGTDGRPTTCAGSPSCGGGCARGSARPSPAERLADASPRSRRPGAGRPAGAAVAVRPHPAAPAPTSPCSPRSPGTATCTCGCRTPRPRCGTGRPRPPRAAPRAARPDAPAAAHPLLAASAATSASCSCASAAPAPATAHRPPSGAGDAPGDAARAAAGRPPRTTAPPAARPALDADDGSVQVHACHGPDRQVEVLREVVLGLLADDPTLEPRDVLVLCPDIETFAPLISASLRARRRGRRDAHPGPPAAGPARRPGAAPGQPAARHAWRRCWSWPTPGVTASQVLDLAESAPVRRRFGFDDDDLDRLRDLVGARRGAVGPRRRAPRRRTGSRRSRRTPGRPGSTGCCSASRCPRTSSDWLGTALPLDDVDSGDVDLRRPARRARRPARRGARPRCAASGPLTAWIDALRRRRSTRLTATAPADAWQLAQARAELAEAAAPPGARTTRRSRWPTSGRCWPSGCAGRPTRANFRTGTLTVATLVPMRSVPHRVVCLLGLDDGVVPPRDAAPTATTCWPATRASGERDPAARTASCCSTRRAPPPSTSSSSTRAPTSAPAPAARPRCRSASCSTPSTRPSPADGERARDHVTCATRCSRSTRATSRRRWPAPVQLRPRRARRARGRCAPSARRPPPFLPGPLPARRRRDTSTLDDLVAFVEHPVKAFLRQRLGVLAAAARSEPADALPVELDGLQRWAIGDRLLRDRLAGRRPRPPACAGRVAARRAAAGPAGRRVLARSSAAQVEPLVRGAGRRLPDDRPRRRRRRRRTAPRRRHRRRACTATTLVTVEYSKLAAEAPAAGVGRLLALTAAHPDRPWRAVTVGRGGRGGADGAVHARAGRPERGAERRSPTCRAARRRAARAAAAACARRPRRTPQARATERRAADAPGRARERVDEPVRRRAATTPRTSWSGGGGAARRARAAPRDRRARRAASARSRRGCGPRSAARRGAGRR